MPTKITKIPSIFAVMKHGLRGYEGEKYAWKTKKINFFHILARIQAEMEVASEKGFTYYPYLTTSASLSNLELIKQRDQPIDVFFTPVKDERHHWLIKYPDLTELKLGCKDTGRHTLIEFSDGTSEYIPCPIRMGDGSRQSYTAFIMKDLEVFTWNERRILDFSEVTYQNISTKKMIDVSLKGSLSFGVFKSVINDNQKSEGYKIDVVARAKLIPPYWGTAYNK